MGGASAGCFASMERDFLGAIDRAWKCGEAAKEESRSEPDSPAATRWQFAARSGVAPAFMSFRTEATGEGSEAFSVSELRPAGDAFDGIKKQSSMLSIYQQQRQFGHNSSQATAQQQYPAAAHRQRSQAADYGAAAPHRLPGGGGGGCRLVQPVSVRHPVPFHQANLMVRSSVSQSFHNQQQPFTMSNNGFGGSTAGVYGARNPRNQASTQLTIFYNGSVNVFDNVPVDKAKELMMLASRASVPAATPSSEPDSPPVPAPAPAKVNVAEVFPGARQIAVQKPEPCVPHLSSAATASPVRIVVPQSVAPSRSTSHCATEACGSKPAAAPTSQTASSSRQLAAASAAAAVTPRAVPQARKASLARFLEKRKERVASVEPYPTSNSKSPLESSDAVGSASAPTKSSSTDVAPASSHNGGGAELVRHGGYPRSISFSTNLQI